MSDHGDFALVECHLPPTTEKEPGGLRGARGEQRDFIPDALQGDILPQGF